MTNCSNFQCKYMYLSIRVFFYVRTSDGRSLSWCRGLRRPVTLNDAVGCSEQLIGLCLSPRSKMRAQIKRNQAQRPRRWIKRKMITTELNG